MHSFKPANPNLTAYIFPLINQGLKRFLQAINVSGYSGLKFALMLRNCRYKNKCPGRRLNQIHFFLLIVFALLSLADQQVVAQDTITAHAIATHGEPKYPADFRYFDYVNPNAPKGGSFRQASEGTFDSFNTFIAKGNPASVAGIESLLVTSNDEPNSAYGLIAESLEYPKDRSWIIFTLRSEARWHDGRPITVDDVIFSLDILKTKGHPSYRIFFAAIEKAEKVGPRQVKFSFTESNNRELPIIAGQIPILPKHYWETRDFEKTTLEKPIGSGPYKLKRFEAGRFYELERVKDYWGEHLPVNVGLNNFDLIRVDYFRDINALRQALKAAEIDIRDENQAKAWTLDYNIPAVENGWLIKELIPRTVPIVIQGFAYNTRRELFKDVKVREALSYAFDFEWTNRTIFAGQYLRTESYYPSSELAARDRPEGYELAVLEKYREQLPESVFSQAYAAPKTNGNGWPRANLLKAIDLLDQAGWRIKNGNLVNAETGKRFEFEILLGTSGFKRIVLPFVHNLKKLGIRASVRHVDQSQYINRLRQFDYDMVVMALAQSLVPGIEQRSFWSSQAAQAPGSQNYPGIQDPVVDALIGEILKSESRETLVARVRALDRVLLSGYYLIPNWHLPADRVLYWNKFSKPDVPVNTGLMTSRWWYDENKAGLLQDRIAGLDEQGQGFYFAQYVPSLVTLLLFGTLAFLSYRLITMVRN